MSLLECCLVTLSVPSSMCVYLCLSVSVCMGVSLDNKGICFLFYWKAQKVSYGDKMLNILHKFLIEFDWVQLTPNDSDNNSTINIVKHYPYVVFNIYGRYLFYKISFNLYMLFSSNDYHSTCTTTHKLPLHQGHGRLPNLRSQIFIALDWLHGKSKKVMLVVRLFSYRQEKQMG